MHKYFADDSGLKRDKDGKQPTIFLFGGIVINSEEENKLREIIKSIKAQYTYPDMPIKWNFRDLREHYVRFERTEDYEKLLAKSLEWRQEIFQKSLAVDYKVVISVLENFQAQKNNLKDIKADLNEFLFSNTLMRLGLFAKRMDIDEIQIILDWPDNKDPKPFNSEYYYAFNRGKSKSGVGYYSGPLEKLGFQESLLFTKMTHSNSLQFADLVVGALRDFLETLLQGRDNCLGKTLTETILNKYDGFPNKVIGLGINISSKNPILKQQLNDIIGKYGA